MKSDFIDLSQNSILLFDGDCLFCNNSVVFILQRDRNAFFKFTSLQSEVGQKLVASKLGDSDLPDSMILINSKGVYFKSRAALKVCQKLDGFWKIFSLLLIIPAFVLDPIYDFIARHRMKLVKNACQLPDKGFKDRFLS